MFHAGNADNSRVECPPSGVPFAKERKERVGPVNELDYQQD
jgi:hypothetical protein